MMGAAPSKAKKWIDQKRDPRSAHWQAGLESLLALFEPVLSKGRMIPVRQMTDEDGLLFDKVLAEVDLSPAVYAAFLPRAVADAVVPPDCAPETLRIERTKPSCKILIQRPGTEDRILCAEISEQAYKPGIDIFQSGALLGSYDYENTQDCLDGLNKAVKAHMWHKETWSSQDFITYTLNWFERVLHLGSSEVIVDKALSFFHSPSRIRTNRVDALFQLIGLQLQTTYAQTDFAASDPVLAEKINARDSGFCRDLAQQQMLERLNLVKKLGLMDFSSFTDKENREFQREFARTEEKLRDRLMHSGSAKR